jgi:hypothetical protein
MKSVKPGAALAPLQTATKKDEAPKREIDRLTLRDGQIPSGG